MGIPVGVRGGDGLIYRGNASRGRRVCTVRVRLALEEGFVIKSPFLSERSGREGHGPFRLGNTDDANVVVLRQHVQHVYARAHAHLEARISVHAYAGSMPGEDRA